MGILYGMVAREQVVLAEFSSTSTKTNASTVARQVLGNMKEANNDNSISWFSHGGFIFHVKRTDGVTVLCINDNASESK